MVKRIFHRWERALASVDNNRQVRPFAWGEDWLPDEGMTAHPDPSTRVREYVDRVMTDLHAWYSVEPAREYGTAPLPPDAGPGERMVTFASAITTPHPENNTVYLRYFPASRQPRRDATQPPRRAVVVMAQWNADEGGHVGLCRLLARLGISAVRISLPYHDRRMPPELSRADYIVSSNIGRTLQVNRQAVLDTRRAVAWLNQQGHERIGLLGTSLGSCLSLLTGAHEPLIKALALNHVSPWFADVIWEGLSTAHVRAGLDTQIDLPTLRDLWRPISPQCSLDRIGSRPTLLVYAQFDLSFPLHLSRDFVRECRLHNIPTTVRILPCGHYTTGVAPFKYLDGYYLASFLRRSL
jgi:pimeloyl-ACP methyl ester carboxylesterase